MLCVFMQSFELPAYITCKDPVPPDGFRDSKTHQSQAAHIHSEVTAHALLGTGLTPVTNTAS